MGRTLILGMGNTIRGDDGVGIIAARALSGQMEFSGIEIKQTYETGINLLYEIAGYEKVIIIDSIYSKGGMPGDIYRFNPLQEGSLKGSALDESGNPLMTYSLHNMGLAAIIKMAGNMIETPEEIIVYAVKIENDGLFSTKLSLEVKKAVPEVVALVKKEMTRDGFGI